MRYLREGGMVRTEDDPLPPAANAGMREPDAAMRHLDDAVTEAGGIVLRYGMFYGADNAAGRARAQAAVPGRARSNAMGVAQPWDRSCRYRIDRCAR